ncbi:MmgE/PrpD family protein [Pseudomonas syringae pv. avellanae str. ISPaVe037]|nr:MmgE/PrpD family protein [Pseudomonas syringae pv. avellanae str. ISPaVe037]
MLADIPQAVQAVAVRCLIDTLGVALAGSGNDVATKARSLVNLTAAAGDCTVLGNSKRLSAPAAAFANATAGHALDFDDNCYAGFVHGSVVIMPAALAVAQMRDLSGSALLTAFVVGAECEYALARMLTRHIYDRGWWTTGVLGSVGACAAACHALGLSAAQTAHALGIALAGTGGMKASFGSDAKVLMAGRASESGVIAALLAEAGSSGPVDIVEHPLGLASMFNSDVLETGILNGLGHDWSLLSPGVDIKRIPVCLSSHAAVDALRELLEEQEIRPVAIERIICDVPPIVVQNLIYDMPVTRQQAQFSLQFALAVTWLEGDVDLDNVNDDMATRKDMLACMQRISLHSSKRWSDTAMLDSAPEGAWVELVFKDGSTREKFCARPVGAASNPLSLSALRAKFLKCSTQVLSLSEAQMLLSKLEQVQHLANVRTLLPESYFIEAH